MAKHIELQRLRLFVLATILSGSSQVAAMQACQTEQAIPATTPTSNFVDHGNGTITDTTTDLMWAKCTVGLTVTDCSGSTSVFNWDGALDAAAASTLAGFMNWRLPNIKELRTIVEHRCVFPSINLEVFPNTPSAWYWSSTPNPDSPNSAWYVYFGNGLAAASLRTPPARQIRLVRGSD